MMLTVQTHGSMMLTLQTNGSMVLTVQTHGYTMLPVQPHGLLLPADIHCIFTSDPVAMQAYMRMF